MKLTHSTAFAVLAYSALVAAAPASTEHTTNLQARQVNQELSNILAELESFKKRDDLSQDEIAKREYQIVTSVLAAITDTDLAPTILNYFATSPVFQPIVIDGIVSLLKSGLINLTSLFQALDQSNLITTVVQQLISDCSLYVELFNIAKGYISNLATSVKSLISGGTAKRRALNDAFSVRAITESENFIDSIDKRDINVDNTIVVNLLDSLGQSGLAAQVVEAIITDSSYIPFAVELISAVIANNALNVTSLIDALKDSSLLPNFLEQILTVNTFQTVATNAFAAYAGKCSTSSASSGGSGSGSGSGGSTATTSPPSTGGSTGGSASPCKRKRKRRSNY